MSKIPSNRHPVLNGYNLADAVNQVINTGRVTMGPQVQKFEQAVKDYYDVEEAISFGSGTLAHHAAVKALKTDPNRKETIVVPAFTYRTTRWALQMAGFDIFYEDINPDTYHFDYENMTHYYEYISFMDTYGSICDTDKHDPYLCVIDACHSFGVPRKELRGRGEVFSFNGGKLFTTGEGGMVITNDSDYAESVKEIRNDVARMPELGAALGLDFMDCIDQILAERQDNANYYTENLRSEFVPQEIPIATNNYMYAVRCPHRNLIIRTLRDEVELRYYYYPGLVSRPNTDQVGRSHMVLPNGVNMQREVESVTETLNNLMTGLVDDK